MSQPEYRISVRQMSVLVFFCVIGDSILIAPGLVAEFAKADAWMSGLLGIVGGIPVAALIYCVSRIRPRDSIVEINRFLLGKWFGGALSLFLLFFYLLNTGTMTRSIGDFITTQMMPETPIRAIHLMLALLLVWALKSGAETIGRAGELFFPWFVLLLVGLLVCLVPKIELNQILPVYAHGIAPVLHGSVFVILYPYAETFSLLMLLPHVANANHVRRDLLLAAVLGGLVIFVVVFVCVLVLGPYLTGMQAYPTYALAKKINVGDFLERVEAILAFLWVISLFFKIVLYGFAFVTGLSRLFRLRDEQLLVLPSIFLFFGMPYVIAPNIVYFSDTLTRKYWPYFDVTIAILIPLLLLAVHAVRKAGSKTDSA